MGYFLHNGMSQNDRVFAENSGYAAQCNRLTGSRADIIIIISSVRR